MEDAPKSARTTTPEGSTSKTKGATSSAFQTPMKPGSTSSLSQAMMITLGDRPTLDKVASGVRIDLSEGRTAPALRILEWLFAVCIGEADKVEFEPETQARFNAALEKARQVANKKDTDLKKGLKELVSVLATTPKGKEDDMYEPLIKVINAAFVELSSVDFPGLKAPTVKPIAINHSRKSPASNNPQADGGYKPDIALISWEKFRQHPPRRRASFSSAGKGVSCTHPWRGQVLGWRELLSTIEVKHEQLTEKQAARKISTLQSQYAAAELKDMDLDPNFGIKTDERPLAPGGILVSSSRPVPAPETHISDSEIATSSALSLSHSNTTTWKIQSGNSTSQSGHKGKKRPVSESDATSEPAAKKAKYPSKMRHPHRVQTAVYAAHLLSSSIDITHSIAMNIIGTEISVGWFNRSVVIESHSFDIIDNLPYFLLLLLILQRFREEHWGYYTSGEGAVLGVLEHGQQNNLMIFELIAPDLRKRGETAMAKFATFLDDIIHQAMCLVGRATNTCGARDTKPETVKETKDIEAQNDLVLKISWPDVKRPSEGSILKKAAERGESISLIKGHIPELVASVHPTGWNTNTGYIQMFLNKSKDPVKKSRQLYFQITKRLLAILKLEPFAMFKAYCDIMFCHRALWRIGIRHGDISVMNMMWDKDKEKGVLNDFDLAKLVSQSEPRGEIEITGTLPFMALDLLTDRGMKGLIPPLYRHELESFTWVLIYLCYTVTKRDDGKFALCVNKLIKKWFLSTKPEHIQAAKLNLAQSLDDLELKPLLYAHYAPLARKLLRFWTRRFHKREAAIASDSSSDPDDTALDEVAPVPYKETDEELLWKMLVNKHCRMVKEEDKIHIDGLLEAYQTTRWPEPIESLDDENDAIIITA